MKLIWTKSSVKQETNLQDFKTKGLKIKNWKLDNRTTYPCASILTPVRRSALSGSWRVLPRPIAIPIRFGHRKSAQSFDSLPVFEGLFSISANCRWLLSCTWMRDLANRLAWKGKYISSHDPCLCLTVYILDFMILYMIVWLCYYYQFPWYHKYSCILLCPICPRWRRGQPALCASIARKRTQMIESVGQLRNVTRTSLKIRWLWHAGPWALRMDGTLQTVVARLQDATCQSQYILS